MNDKGVSMSMQLKAGARLFGAACTTEVIVVKAPSEPVDLCIGGHPALTSASDRTDGLEVLTPVESKPAMGKRYTNADGTLEVLCTKVGAGAVALGTELLAQKDAKPLPSSD
jgi:hypothetical protein